MRNVVAAWIVVSCTLSACQVLTGISPLDIGPGDAGIKIDPVVAAGSGGGGSSAAGGSGGEASHEPDKGGSGGMMMQADAGPLCEREDGAECNWIEDCGCSAGQHCQLRGASDKAKATCVKRGKRKTGESCSSPDECDNGTCDGHVCRDYCTDHCDGGRCLPATGEGGKALADVHVCWMSCQIDSKDTCPNGTTCQSREVDGSKAAFCLPPADPCPTTEDGKCDEPVLCATGTDAVDCSCKKDEGTECSLVAQCGCAKGKSCSVSPDTKLVCVAPGPLKVDEPCHDDTSCGAGLNCTFNPYGSCKKYCATAADCPHAGDDCLQVTNNGKDIPGFKICRSACSESAPCPAGNSCVKTNSGSFCRPFEPEIPNAPCNLTFQMGCDGTANSACDVSISGSDVSAACKPHTGQQPVGSMCDDASQCEAGTTCVGSVCRRYCALNFKPETSGCAGTCSAPTLSDKSKAPFGVCFEPCPASLQCGDGLQCMHSSFGEICSTPLTSDCPTSNKTCDEPMPKGTGLCAAGFDTAECMGTP